MDANKVDRRVKYTQAALRQSLLKLMETRSIASISVKQICELADVSRGTFYAHYRDPHDLLTSIEEDLFRGIEGALERHTMAGSNDMLPNTHAAVLEIIEFIGANYDVCQVLLGENGDMEFIEKIMFSVQRRCVSIWAHAINDGATLEYIFAFLARGSVAIIQRWIVGKMPEPPADIALIISLMTQLGLQAYLGSASALGQASRKNAKVK